MLKADGDGPVSMLNLLKFKDRATYKDGEDVSGETAYRRYASAFAKLVAGHGVTTNYSGRVLAQLIGEGADWDAAAIVTYPNAAKMIEMTSSDDYRKIHYHRRAGLDGQLLLACGGEGLFE